MPCEVLLVLKALVRRGLTRLVRLPKFVEPVDVSGDETDGDVKTHPPKMKLDSAETRVE